MSEIPKLLNPDELSEILNISVNTLANDRYLGQGVPYIKVGKRVRYRLEDVLAYLEAQRVATAVKQ